MGIAAFIRNGLAARRSAAQAKKERQEALRQRDELIGELRECRLQLEHTDSMFNLVCDPDLVESCIYQYRALQARYDGLLLAARAGSPDARRRAEV